MAEQHMRLLTHIARTCEPMIAAMWQRRRVTVIGMEKNNNPRCYPSTKAFGTLAKCCSAIILISLLPCFVHLLAER